MTDRELMMQVYERLGTLIAEQQQSRTEMVALRESNADLAGLLARVDERVTTGQHVFAENLRRHSERSRELDLRLSAIAEASEERDEKIGAEVSALKHAESERRGMSRVLLFASAGCGTVIGGVVTALLVRWLGG